MCDFMPKGWATKVLNLANWLERYRCRGCRSSPFAPARAMAKVNFAGRQWSGYGKTERTVSPCMEAFLCAAGQDRDDDRS